MTSGVPNPCHQSAYRAVIFSVTFSPPPPTRIGSFFWIGRVPSVAFSSW